MKVVVNTPNSISVRINEAQQEIVHGTSTFVGASSQEAQIQGAYNAANSAVVAAQAATVAAAQAYNASNVSYAAANTALTEVVGAYSTANSSFAFANTRFSANGGIIYGNVQITGNILPTTANTYSLGTQADPFQSIFVGPGSIHIDGVTLSNTSNGLTIQNTTSLNVAANITSTGTISGTFDAGLF
jgi:riboflavin synthase alpha subunit